MAARGNGPAPTRRWARPAAPLLRLSDVGHHYGERPVLSAVELSLDPGDGVALTGPNGCGKSTLLRLAAGRERPTRGTVTHHGRRVSEERREIRAAFATALDRGADYPDLSVREHLLLVALAHGLAEDADDTVDEALAAHRLTGHAQARPTELSSGLRQLLALATTAVRPYQLLVLDEPEQHLDDAARRGLAARLVEARRRGAAVLLATHDTWLAAEVADRVRTMRDGVLGADAGTPPTSPGPPDAPAVPEEPAADR